MRLRFARGRAAIGAKDGKLYNAAGSIGRFFCANFQITCEFDEKLGEIKNSIIEIDGEIW